MRRYEENIHAYRLSAEHPAPGVRGVRRRLRRAGAGAAAGRDRDLVSEGTDRSLQEGVRSEESRHQGRDPQQADPRGRLLHPRSAGQQQARRVLGFGARRIRGAVRRKAARQNRVARQGSAGEDRQLPDQRSEGLLPRPGARRLRHHVEHALPEGEQAARAQGVGRSGQAGLFQPRRHFVAVALGHHAPDGRDHPARRRLGQRLAPDADDRRQLRRDHRAQLRRARRRQQRPVRASAS